MRKVIPPVVQPGTLADVPQPEITVDADLLLRPWHPSDVAAVLDAFSAPDIQLWHVRRCDTVEEAEAWVTESNEGWRCERCASWAIVRRVAGQVVGRVSVHTMLSDGLGEIAYWVLPDARTDGVATRAVVAATRWAHELGLHRIELQHSTRNEMSRRVALGAGFVEEGVRRGSGLHDDGWHDMRLYSHLATDSI